MRHEAESLDPLFSKNHFLSGTASGRDGPIRAQCGLRWHWKDHDNSERISEESCERSRILVQGRYWAISRPESFLSTALAS